MNRLENVFLYNVDHLEAIIRENVRQREQELARCQAILQERTLALMCKLAPAPERNDVARAPAWAIPATASCQVQLAGAGA